MCTAQPIQRFPHFDTMMLKGKIATLLGLTTVLLCFTTSNATHVKRVKRNVLVKADPTTCKAYCKRNLDDTIAYDCAVRPARLIHTFTCNLLTS